MNMLLSKVLGLPYFDSKGLFLAFEDEQPVGLAHAGFGPNVDKSDIDLKIGVISLILIVPTYSKPNELASQLLQKCEEYLRGRGAEVIYGGATRTNMPFYCGLYGGSEPIGVDDSEQSSIHAYTQSGFTPHLQTQHFREDLRHFRPKHTLKSIGWINKLTVDFFDQPPLACWFQACSASHYDWIRAVAYSKNKENYLGEVLFRLSRPMDGITPQTMTPPVAALLGITVEPEYQKKGVATYLMGETLRRLVNEFHVNQLEALATEEDAPFKQLVRTLGWKPAETGQVFIKRT